MITTNVKLQLLHQSISMPVSDYVFSALRGPDETPIDSKEYPKRLGAAFIRFYLRDYEYGAQTTLMEWLYKVMNDQVNLEVIVNELILSKKHYTYHMSQGLIYLSESIRNYYRLSPISIPLIVKEELEIIETLSTLWDEVDSYISRRNSWKNSPSLKSQQDLIEHYLISFCMLIAKYVT